MENNRVYLQGRLCHAPRLLQTRSQRAKAVFRLAIPRSIPAGTWRSPISGKQELSSPPGPNADFVTVVVLGARATEIGRQQLEKGMWINVSGWLRSWDRPSLHTSGVLEVVAEHVETDKEHP